MKAHQALIDPARVRQILSTLLSNAVKYTRAGSVMMGAERRSEGGPRPGEWIAISRRIARLLGGDITVESQLDRGSTFTFWLPVIEPSRAPAT